ncbi:MAG: S8 family peptidase [Desulfitobacteriaceae bacterium]
MQVRKPILAAALISAVLCYSFILANIPTYTSSTQLVDVIVQKASHTPTHSLLQSVRGVLLAELPVIHGFIAQVPQNKLVQLGQERGVLRYSLNHPLQTTGAIAKKEIRIGQDNEFNRPGKLENIYQEMVKADDVHETGKGVGVALLDSGAGASKFSKSHLNLEYSYAINPLATTTDDLYGHGTHVAGIINGQGPKELSGIAPEANLINVKLGDNQGNVSEIDLLLGLQWVYDFREKFNIKVVNLSVSSTESVSYIQSPLSAAVEQLWLNGVTVIVAAGNSKTNPNDINYPPANDPFVITVGSVDGNGKSSPRNAVLSTWSKHGKTSEGIAKPNVTAPGADIISLLSERNAILATEHPQAVIANNYLEMSGTSMAAPVVSGVAALMLEANPHLTPNQVKAILTKTSVPYKGMLDNAGVIDAKEAIKLAKDEKQLAALTPIEYNVWPLSKFMGDSGRSVDYTKASWGSLDWLKASWGSMDWTKASWGSLDWAKASWGSIDWAKASWGSAW